jgi:hypothetical protein
MTRLMLLCAWLCVMAFVVAASPAQAMGYNAFSFVSNTGNDSNDCATPATACATFSGALAKTTTFGSGEIDCVNAGFYGGNNSAFTIAQTVTIDCAGGVGSTFGPITINGAGIVVRLRNLSLNGVGFGGVGIDGQNMAALYIENCVITNFDVNSATPPSLGIKFAPSASSLLFVTNTIIANNGVSTSVSGGIDIVPANGVHAEVSVDRSQINGNYFGIIADGTAGGTIRGTISDSVVSGNAQNGITVSTSGSGSAVLIIDQTKVTGNGNHGLAADGSGAGMLVRNTSVFNNAAGLFTENGATLYSYGNNSVNGNNGNDGSFTGTIGLK